MCFSASASFIASASLGLLGIASLKKVKEPSQYAFAGIPLIFAIQQFTEGIVWLSMTHPGLVHYEASTSLIYLLFAQVIWPVWLPLSFYLFEKEEKRRKLLRLFLLPGLMVSAYFLFCLLSYKIETVAAHHHVFYNLDFPISFVPVAAGFYLVATVFPPLLSRRWYIRFMGIIILAAYLVARIFFQPSLISVWCFFAIAIGFLVFLLMRQVTHQEKKI